LKLALYTSFIGKAAISTYYTADNIGDGELASYGFGEKARAFSEIDYGKFSNDARIEIHGCMTAAKWDYVSIFLSNVVEDISKQLWEAGKTNAVVIGHTTKSNPNMVQGSSDYSKQDYRHGNRAIYHNGELLFETKIKGPISYRLIQEHLIKKFGP
jgi:hypothetical protein